MGGRCLPKSLAALSVQGPVGQSVSKGAVILFVIQNARDSLTRSSKCDRGNFVHFPKFQL